MQFDFISIYHLTYLMPYNFSNILFLDLSCFHSWLLRHMMVKEGAVGNPLLYTRLQLLKFSVN